MMKIGALILLFTCGGVFLMSCHSTNDGSGTKKFKDDTRKAIRTALTNYPEQYPVFSVADTAYDFGTIHAGDVVQYDFRFKNTGSKPLIITGASASCGCTVPQYPKEPVAPGGEGKLRVVFNSAGKSGKQYKLVFVNANTMPAHFNLKITCNVVSK